MNVLNRFWNTQVWNKPLRLLVFAVVLTPLGGFIAAPFLAGRAAEIYAERNGRKHSFGLGVAVGVLWFALIFVPLFVWYYWFAGP